MNPLSPLFVAVLSAVAGVSMAGAGVFLLWGLGWALLLGSAPLLGLSAVLARGLIRAG